MYISVSGGVQTPCTPPLPPRKSATDVVIRTHDSIYSLLIANTIFIR